MSADEPRSANPTSLNPTPSATPTTSVDPTSSVRMNSDRTTFDVDRTNSGRTNPDPTSAKPASVSPITAARLHTSPNALAPHYSRFRVGDRLLLTGHSHQAWPDVGLAAQQQAWLDAADLADRKWGRVGEVADRV